MTAPPNIPESGDKIRKWYWIAPPGVSAADVSDGKYWSGAWETLRAGHRIEAVSHDYSWWAMLLVTAVSEGSVTVAKLISEDLSQMYRKSTYGHNDSHATRDL